MPQNPQPGQTQHLEPHEDRIGHPQCPPVDPIDEPCEMCGADAGEPCRLSCMPDPLDPNELLGA